MLDVSKRGVNVERKTIEEYMPLARHVAKRYVGQGIEREDLVSIAYLGLSRAWNDFDVDRYWIKFSTFAYRYIQRELWQSTDKLRRQKRAHQTHLEYRDDLYLPQRKQDVETTWDLRDLIAKLPKRRRAAIVLWMKGYTPTEIAEINGYTTRVTADRARHLAVESLKSAYGIEK